MSRKKLFSSTQQKAKPTSRNFLERMKRSLIRLYMAKGLWRDYCSIRIGDKNILRDVHWERNFLWINSVKIQFLETEPKVMENYSRLQLETLAQHSLESTRHFHINIHENSFFTTFTQLCFKHKSSFYHPREQHKN